MTRKRLLRINDSIDHSLSELFREARKQARRAQLSGDRALQRQILQHLDVAEQKRRSLEERELTATLSRDQVDVLVKELSNKKDQAKKLLVDFRAQQKSLEGTKVMAERLAKLVGSIEKIVG